MRALSFFLGTAAFACGCSAILGLPDVVLDDSIGRDAGSGADVVVMPDQMVMDAPVADTTGNDAPPADTGSDAAKTPIALTMGNRPWGLAIDDQYVFWSEPFNFVIGRVGKDGSNPVSLATGSNLAFGVRHVAADGSDVFWVRLDTVYRCARGGCNNAPSPIAQNLANSAFAVAVDMTHVYFAQDSSFTLHRVPKGGGSVTTLATLSELAQDLVVTGGFVYATLANGSLVSVPVTGGNPTVIVQPGSSSLLALAIQGGFAYYNVFGDPGQVAFAPLSGGGAPLALNQRYPFGITVDLTDVYWTNTVTLGPNGNVSKCSLAMCVTPAKIADNQDTPKWIRNDQTAIYWTNAGNGPNSGGVMKLSK